MPYEPTTWETGDVITAEKFNSVSPYISEITISTGENIDLILTTNKTAGDIFEAVQSGRPCIFIITFVDDGYAQYDYLILHNMSFNGDEYTAYISMMDFASETLNTLSFTASSANDPLVYTSGGK